MARTMTFLTGVLVLVLSAQLYGTRGERAVAMAELLDNTAAFVRGAPLPDVPLRMGEGETSVAELCAEASPVMVLLTQEGCPACTALDPLWKGASGSGYRRIQVHLGGATVALSGGGDPDILHTSATPGSVTEGFRVWTVPAVVVTDSECRVEAAGAGLLTSRALITGRAGGRP